MKDSSITEKLEQCPEVLQEKVNEYLEEYSGSKILGVTIIDGLQLYKDKTITQSIYRVALIYETLCTTMTFRLISKAEWNKYEEVDVRSMYLTDIVAIANGLKVAGLW